MHFELGLFGPFRLRGSDGRRINIASKKGQAVVAMLAVSGGGERTRSWLQNQVWGSRGQDQAQASLRSELSALRLALNIGNQAIIHSDKNRVWIDLSLLKIDARETNTATRPHGEFLEGLDIPGEDAFEEWLREERARLLERIARGNGSIPKTQALPPEDAQSVAPTQFTLLPALAVLPFANLTGDRDQDFLAEGISEDLIDRLSRLRWLPIIARSSSFSIAAEETDVAKIGQSLGARYVLDGRVRAHTTGVILAASLVDCENGQVVWSNKLALDKDHTPEVLEELLAGLTSTLGTKIDLEEQSRALRKSQRDLVVRDLIWRGRWHLNRFTREDAALAKEFFSQAFAQEPNSGEAIIQLAWSKLWDVWALRGSMDEIRDVRQMAQKAIIADYDDARGHMIAGIAEGFMRQPIRAESMIRRAIELNPSLVLAHGYLGSALYLNDQPDAAIESLNVAVRLSPNDQHLFYLLGELATANVLLGQNEQAIDHAEQALMRRPAYWYAHVLRAVALFRLGRAEEARWAYDELIETNRGFSDAYIEWVPFIDSKWNDILKNNLNLARGQND